MHACPHPSARPPRAAAQTVQLGRDCRRVGVNGTPICVRLFNKWNSLFVFVFTLETLCVSASSCSQVSGRLTQKTVASPRRGTWAASRPALCFFVSVAIFQKLLLSIVRAHNYPSLYLRSQKPRLKLNFAPLTRLKASTRNTRRGQNIRGYWLTVCRAYGIVQDRVLCFMQGTSTSTRGRLY